LFAVSSSALAISVGCNDRYIGICQGTLGLLPVSGGSPREVEKDVLAADWTADGSEMGVIRQAGGEYRVEFPRGKVLYKSYHPLGYLRIAPDTKSVAFAEFVAADGDAGWAIAVDRSGKELIHSKVYVSVEGLAWPPAGEEVGCRNDDGRMGGRDSCSRPEWQGADCSPIARHSSASRHIARWANSFGERIVEKRAAVSGARG
jgi:hypothetical protein